LETDVMRVLWAEDAPMSPAEVLDDLDAGLAYTSIATVLNRLCEKGLVSRRPSGRKFLYQTTSTEADLTGQRIHSILDAAGDRRAALTGFLNTLNDDDAEVLRTLLEDSK
jgi:predicted transcriptional regulator